VQRFVVFRAESRKGATRDIMRPISEELCLWLAEMRRGDEEKVWPWKGNRSSLWHHFKMLCRQAGVTKRGFHGFRKSAASYIALAGGDAAATQLLDHSNAATTKAHYIDVTIAKPKHTAIDLLPPLNLGSTKPPSVADAKEAAQRAGYARGKALAAESSPLPDRAAQDELAASDGVPTEHRQLYRQGLALGWSAAHEVPTDKPAA